MPNRSPKATGRELQVLELAAAGCTDKQIALRLEISKDTVASYWRRILLKYRAVNRTEVVARHVEQRAHESIGLNPVAKTEVANRALAQAAELAQRNLVQAITESSLEVISGKTGFRQAFERLLKEFLGLTQSEYGFLSEVLYDDGGAPYIRTHALTNIAWDRATRDLYERNYVEGLEFRNLDTLFGQVLTSQEAVIANDPLLDPRRGGLPAGHPPMNSFLGIPVHSGDDFVGMIGRANRPNGYEEEVLEYLKPLIATYANFIVGWKDERQRRVAEQRLAESEAMVRTLTDAIPAAVLYEDRERRLQFVNRKFLQVFGADGDPDQFVGADCAEVARASIHLFQDPTSFLARVDELIEGQTTVLGDLITLANGNVYEHDFIVVRQGSVGLGYLWKYREVTVLRSEHATLNQILDAALDAVITINADGKVQYWNARATSLFGYKREEALGHSLAELIVPPELRAAHRAGIRRVCESGRSEIMDSVIAIDGQHRDGHRLSVDLVITKFEEFGEVRFCAFLRERT